MRSIIARRRHPAAGYAAVAGGLVAAGVLYSTLSSGGASASAPAQASTQIAQGKSLFVQSCSSCHGLDAQGTSQAPSLVGAGAAAVYFQMSTGRMPAKELGAENERKPTNFTEQQIYAIADYVASLGGGPPIPS
ncbi:MAG: c-type cytochrome [Trebonia sp.]